MMIAANHGEQGDHERSASRVDQPGTADSNNNNDVSDERCATTTMVRVSDQRALGPELWIPTADHSTDCHVSAASFVDPQFREVDMLVTDLEREGTTLASTSVVDRTNACAFDHDCDSMESLLGDTLSRVAGAIDDLIMDIHSEGKNDDDALSRDDLSIDEETADRNTLPVATSTERSHNAYHSSVSISRGTDETTSTAKHTHSKFLSSAILMDCRQPSPVWSDRSSKAGNAVMQFSDPSGAVQTIKKAEVSITKLNDAAREGRANSTTVKFQDRDGRNDAAKGPTNAISEAEVGTETHSTDHDDALGLATKNSSTTGAHWPRRQVDFSSFLLKRRSTQVPPIAPSRPARVEPKSFFANERTFIQWISIALLLATIESLTPSSDIPVIAKLRVSLMACSGVLIIYSVSVYYWRLSLLRHGAPYGYTDRVGPLILVIAVLFGGSILFITKYGGETAGSELTELQEDRDCRRYYHGMSSLEYEPSDVTVHSSLLLIPSHSVITAISTAWSNTARTLITIPGTDIEAISVVDSDRLFVVSEGSVESVLIQLVWNENKDAMKIAGNWTLDLKFIEGLAYIPGGGGDDDDGQLFYGDDQGRIHATAIPKLKSSGSALDILRLNDAVFRRGLVDPKISALQYLDGLLYVLHDNAGIVRGWDIAAGELLLEWKLPVPPDSFGTANQIEGFFLERMSGSLRHRAKYLMHLAVDTPAQIWTISIEVDHANGHAITYPACALGAIPAAL